MTSIVPGLGASLMLPAGEVALCSACTGPARTVREIGRVLFKLQRAAVKQEVIQ